MLRIDQSVGERISALAPEQRALFERLRAGQRKAAAPKVHQPPPIARRSPPDGTGDWPLSFDQERMWALYYLEPQGTAYTIDTATQLTGPLQIGPFRRAMAEIVRRHAAWRTVFALVDGRPVQRVLAALAVPLPLVDLSGLAPARRRAAALAVQAVDGRTPFDLERGPLVRTALLRLSPEEHIFLVTVHHIVTDWVTFQLLWRELAILYAKEPLPEPPVCYSDYALWQREWMRGEVLGDLLGWWREQLRDMPLVLDLPTDRPRPAINRLRGDEIPLRAGAELAAGVHALARSEGLTPFMAVLAFAQALFHLYSGQEKLLLGSNNANRNRPEIEGVFGFFLTQVVFAGDLSGDPTVRELLGRARRSALDAYAHQDLPFIKLIEELQPERDPSRQPLVQALVLLLDGSHVEHELGGLGFRGIDVRDGSSRYDVLVGLWAVPDAIFGGIEYNSDLFDASTAVRLGEAFLQIMAAAVADPGLRLSQLPFLSAAARHQLLAEWSGSPPAAPGGTVLDRFAARVAAAPDAPALFCAGAVMTFGELDRAADRLAGHLRLRGVGKDSRVALLLPKSPELVATLLAVWKAGAAAVILDPALPRDRLAVLLADAEPAMSIESGTLGDLAADPGVEPLPAPEASSLAYLLYTSGTTGVPKAVLVEHGSLLFTLDALIARFGFGPGDRMPHLARFSFDIAFFELLAPLLAGGACEILAEDEVLEPERLRAALARSTRVHAVPSLMRQIAALARECPPPALRTLFTGGDRVPPDLLAGLLEVFPRAEVAVLYGPTEAAVVCSAWSVPRAERPARSLIGRPLPGVGVRVLDRHGRLAPPGAPGELCIGGPGVARGYFRREELTAERFFARDGERWYRSGDLVRWLPDGSLEFLGRTDDQVKIRGFRVEPGEIEAVLAAHPVVRAAVVVARQDAIGGEERRLVAYAVPAVEPAPAGLAAALRQHLAARLPAYMVPSDLVILRELPLTGHGKVDRARLPAPPPRPAAAFEPPRTPVEEMAADIWREVLGVPRVGRHDDFFALGGHSLLATQAMIRLRDATGIELPVRILFQAPTLEALAAAVAERQAAGAASSSRTLPPLVAVPRDGSPLPLSFAQERLWFLDRLAPGNPAYNLALALRIDGPLDVRRLAGAFAALVSRHEALRTRFPELAADGKPMQVIEPAEGAFRALRLTDLEHLGAAADAEVLRLAAADALRPFDLAAGPPLRATLLRLDEARHVLLLAIHHIVSDAWSMGILVRELTALYGGEDLAPLPVQFADYAVWQRARLDGAEMERQLAFWRGHLSGAPVGLDLPVDRPRPPVPSLRGGRVPVGLPADVSGALAERARDAGATLYMTLLAAWAVLLSRLSGQADLVLGTAVANRDRPELERLIGLFVNTLALRLDLDGDPAFVELVARARRTVLDAFAHRDLPFEKLVEELHPARERSRQPVFQVMLTFQNVPPGTAEVAGLALAPLAVEDETAKFDLTLTLFEADGCVRGNLEYASDLFERATAARLAGHFQTLLAGAATVPAARLGELPLLTAAERRQVLTAWNGDAAELPPQGTIHELLSAQAARAPDAVAVVCGDASLSYGEVARRARRLARRLLALGIAPEERVALYAGRSPELIIAFLGILAAGAAYLPLDPSSPPERLAWMLADAGARVLLAGQDLARAAELLAAVERGSLRVLWLEELEDAGEPPAWPLPEVPAASLAYVMYTSGSTGTPKGVAVTHRNVVRLVRPARGPACADLGPQHTWLQLAPVSFDAATLEIWAPLLNGGRLALFPALFPGDGAAPDAIGEAVARYGVTSLWLTAGLFHQVVDQQVEALRPLRQLLAGGDAVSPAHARRALEALPGLTLIDGYGPTEGTTFTCCQPLTDPRQIGPAAVSVPIGAPIAHARAYVLDACGQPAPPGVPGELLIGGEGLARGYLGRPELTAERFVPDPFADVTGRSGERLYRTGDRVRRLANGALELLGRDDGQVKIRGFRVESGEVEAALAAHPAVARAAVVAREARAGKELVACVVPSAPGQVVPAGELQRFLRARLPAPMIPAAWTFTAALPLTANGKLDRRALAALVAGSAAEVRAAAAYQAPRTPLEEQLVAACAETLGLAPERVGVLDNFFDLGGHSLLATQLVALLRLRYGVEAPLALLFDAASLADLAERITERELSATEPALLEEMMAGLGEGIA